MFLLRELYEQEQYHPENNNYHLGVPGNDWPHITASRPDMKKSCINLTFPDVGFACIADSNEIYVNSPDLRFNMEILWRNFHLRAI